MTPATFDAWTTQWEAAGLTRAQIIRNWQLIVAILRAIRDLP